MTHLVLVSEGKLAKHGPVNSFPELKEGNKLLHTAIKWLRAERDQMRAHPKEKAASKTPAQMFGSRQMAFFR
jgi:hypothetical protein